LLKCSLTFVYILLYSECFPLLSGGFSVFAGVGERTREGNDLYREMIESGVIKLGDQQVNTMLFMTHILFTFIKVLNYGCFMDSE